MKKTVLLSLLSLSLCAYSQNAEEVKMNKYIDNLMSKMTLEEKIGQLNLATSNALVTGSTFSENVNQKLEKGEIGAFLNVGKPEEQRKAQELVMTKSRMKIPLFFGLDVIHGYKTIYPTPLGVSSSWNPALIEKAVRRATEEATSIGINWVYSPMVDISRDPRWGRVSEGSGEDPYLGGEIAKAMIRGIQGNDLKANNTAMACVKHFALYGASEAGRDYNTVDMSKVQMYNYYLSPYKAAVDAGAGSIMTSFNIVDGVPASANKWLMTDLLRKDWGFKGFVVTDYTAINEMVDHGVGDLKTVSAKSLNAGVDMDMVGEGFLTTLKKSVEDGSVKVQDINVACRRILEAKYKLGLFEDPYRYLNRTDFQLVSAESRALAREVAKESIVLLKNDKQTLPLEKKGKIALIGPLANAKFDMVGAWAFTATPTDPISIKEGLEKAVGDKATISYAKGANLVDDEFTFNNSNFFGVKFASKDERTPEAMLQEAIDVAKESDIVVVALGEGLSQSGEATSRTNLDLFANQKTLLQELVKTGKPVVLILINGRPLTLTWEDQNCHAILEAWAPGIEAGNAIADVVFGDYNPSAKITMTFPRSVGQIPIYYNHLNTGRPYVKGGQYKFKSNYLDEVNEPLYPFGYGLSYTTFEYSDIKLSSTTMSPNGKIEASVTVSNTGKRDGEEVVQLYIKDEVASISRPVKELKGFEKISLKAGESKTVKFDITAEQLKFYNSNLKYVCEPGSFQVMIGGNSRDLKTNKFELTK